MSLPVDSPTALTCNLVVTCYLPSARRSSILSNPLNEFAEINADEVMLIFMTLKKTRNSKRVMFHKNNSGSEDSRHLVLPKLTIEQTPSQAVWKAVKVTSANSQQKQDTNTPFPLKRVFPIRCLLEANK
jgi:hypothetical protein